MTTNNKNNGKSMFLYTALIFIVAILLIIISFFGQTHLKNSQPKVDENPAQTQALSGISEKAAILSEENKNLLEENNSLKTENEKLLEKQVENDLLLSANGYFSAGNYPKAGELIAAVNYDNLSVDQKIIYDNIKNNIQ